MNPAEEHLYFFLGVDPAPSESQRSDHGALVVGCARPRNVPSEVRAATQHRPTQFVLSQNEADWWFDFCYARRITLEQKLSARQWSGLIHLLDQRFRFEGIGLDPGGGGVFLKRELIAHEQLINGVQTSVVPIGDLEDGPKKVTHGRFIVVMFKRGDPGVEMLWPELAGDELLVDGLFCTFKEGHDNGIIGYPPRIEEILSVPALRALYQTWPEERQWSAKNLTAMQEQAREIVVATNDDEGQTYKLTKRGAHQFSTSKKKDFVSAGQMAYARFLIWLKMGDFTPEVPEDAVGIIGARIR